ncbi:MAG: type II toxin-antitoxin system HicB family antitoxin [Candidatus Aminicenantes bacterium]|nr:type II toxin-antitoxin system HicB family antitoxin [Candidatus Aminicenantes bacterium]
MKADETLKLRKCRMNLSIRVEIFKEDDVYVAVSPELNVSSFGETIYEAKESITEAIEAFFEECREMRTLNEVLEESGFLHVENSWQSRQPVAEAYPKRYERGVNW